MLKTKITVMLLFNFLLFASCDTNSPSLYLTILPEEASCTEAWINVMNYRDKEVILERNGEEIRRINLTGKINTILDTALTPNTSYKYRLIRTDGEEQSNEITITTLTPTSHEFKWEVYRFGDNRITSYFEDVALTENNEIWAVGNFKLAGSQGEWVDTVYNAAHWDGEKWEKERFNFKGMGNYSGYSSIAAVTTFNQNLVFYDDYGGYLEWNGSRWKTEYIQTGRRGGIEKAWGTGLNNIYLACSDGGITYYNGESFQLIESGTTTDIYDVWGYRDIESGEEIKLFAVSYIAQLGEMKLLKLDGKNNLINLNWPFDRSLVSVWTTSGNVIYTAGDGVFENKSGHWRQNKEVSMRTFWYAGSF
jgi:hypothetical protein